MLDAAKALKIVNELESNVNAILAEMPELVPFMRKILEPIMNGHQEPLLQGKKRTISEETRAKMRAAAAKRWGKKHKK